MFQLKTRISGFHYNVDGRHIFQEFCGKLDSIKLTELNFSVEFSLSGVCRWIHSNYKICIQFTFHTLADARMVLHQLQLFKDIFQLAVQKVEQTFFSFFPSCKSYKETRHHQFHILCWWHIMNSSAFLALAEAFLFPTKTQCLKIEKKSYLNFH